jgi:hypothetical protein
MARLLRLVVRGPGWLLRGLRLVRLLLSSQLLFLPGFFLHQPLRLLLMLELHLLLDYLLLLLGQTYDLLMLLLLPPLQFLALLFLLCEQLLLLPQVFLVHLRVTRVRRSGTCDGRKFTHVDRR